MNPVEIADRAEGRFSRVGGRRERAQGAAFCDFRRKRASSAEFGYESTVTPDEVMAEVKSGQARPVYLVTGEEQYLVERVLAAIRAAVSWGAGSRSSTKSGSWPAKPTPIGSSPRPGRSP